jgi:hypothetical protein
VNESISGSPRSCCGGGGAAAAGSACMPVAWLNMSTVQPCSPPLHFALLALQNPPKKRSHSAPTFCLR